MLNFDNLDGFVVDLTTRENALREAKRLYLENYADWDSYDHQDLIWLVLDYLTYNYDYIFCKKNNVYQVVEEDLCCREQKLYSLEELTGRPFKNALNNINRKGIFNKHGDLVKEID